MNYRISDIVVIILSVAVMGWSLLWIQQLLFGIVAVVGLTTTYAKWRQEQPEEAGLLMALWSLIAVAAWTSNLRIILGSIAIAAIVYAAWTL